MFHSKKLFGGNKVQQNLHMQPQAYRVGATARHELFVGSAQSIRWVSTETNPDGQPAAIRIPNESTRNFSYPGNFIADGKTYKSWEQLCQKKAEIPGVYTDIYGRNVVYYSELFPCFDSFDYLYEKRRHRWFFLLGDGKMTRVVYADEQEKIHVTEDVANIETKCWNILKDLPFWNQESCTGKEHNL